MYISIQFQQLHLVSNMVVLVLYFRSVLNLKSKIFFTLPINMNVLSDASIFHRLLQNSNTVQFPKFV